MRYRSARKQDVNRIAIEPELQMSQLADVFAELHKHPFYQFGSLDTPGELHIAPFSRESLTTLTDSQLQSIGPCSSLQDYYTSALQLILDLILRQEKYSRGAVDAYLIHCFLLDVLPRVMPKKQARET
ncbi:hypothetical protein CDD80_3155 [Ophiocordyceps camponoti-rufipedis]|uniref:Uncharacterized protein n=1 Tax=Ophiocordyceps camponoti-rufipedis TaxID=2004952 RepID=A0A2C5Z2X3_9HYPO|nr:hypothetical protein CDD80_3155 [Ophiocordyceps camponoti-rufipedis]